MLLKASIHLNRDRLLKTRIKDKWVEWDICNIKVDFAFLVCPVQERGWVTGNIQTTWNSCTEYKVFMPLNSALIELSLTETLSFSALHTTSIAAEWTIVFWEPEGCPRVYVPPCVHTFEQHLPAQAPSQHHSWFTLPGKANPEWATDWGNTLRASQKHAALIKWGFPGASLGHDHKLCPPALSSPPGTCQPQQLPQWSSWNGWGLYPRNMPIFWLCRGGIITAGIFLI